MSINAFLFSSFNQSSGSIFAIFTENGSAICVSYASRKCFTVIGLWSLGWCDDCLWPAHTMRRQLDRFDLRIGQTTIALVKSTDDDRLSCAHTMRFSSFRLLCVQQKTKIAWCEPGLTQTKYYRRVYALTKIYKGAHFDTCAKTVNTVHNHFYFQTLSLPNL